ncbi:hypothetical protein K466DRAFT_83441 [Polyporus arcularius HHB13444]|uniref:Uncharacterized protein n=1 Tax=Polyporus arcularius HHB13444 TaxID=1314778 RepID=A0A5C3PFY1_9APHY|nr:hypothetical protein K466DRAFT_83441 [Polyporus arcularius HHB13444]
MLSCLAPSLTSVCGTWSLWRRCAILHLPRCELEKRLAGTLILKAQKKSASMSRHRSKKLGRRTRSLTQPYYLGQTCWISRGASVGDNCPFASCLLHLFLAFDSRIHSLTRP